jgi:hemerythrin
MPLIEWNPYFETGIEHFDDQHREIITMINDLHATLCWKQDNRIISDMINHLIDFWNTHIADEEYAMHTLDYPETHLHEIEHQKLIIKIMEFSEKLANNEQDLTSELTAFLLEWFHDHILITDKKYKDFFLEKGLPDFTRNHKLNSGKSTF